MTRRGRFAPSPTGELHLGNALTALFAWLQMRQVDGCFVLRMEDIDTSRARPSYAQQIADDLRWIGLDWDEGPDVGGASAPYTQSERHTTYEEALLRLGRDGWLYPCYCSRAELAAIASAPHGLASEGAVYPRTCRTLSIRERAEREALKAPALRFAMPDEEVVFHDLAAGTQRFRAGAGGDFIVKRADGVIGYQLAVVCDDAVMGITDVLRGYDLLDSTPRQIHLYRALGYEPPQFTHVPLLLGPNGERLSKRDIAITVAGIRSVGTSPEQLVGCLGYLGGLQDRPDPVQAREMVPKFDLSRVPRHPVTVTAEVLQLLSGQSNTGSPVEYL